MKLTVFFGQDGDCLLLRSADGHHVLVDGGRKGTFERHTSPVLQQLAEAQTPLDLVCVSHIDADHISGIIGLLEDVAAWTVFDHQVGEGQNPTFPQPRRPRPPAIGAFWHNSWRAQLGDLAGPVQAMATNVAAAIDLAPDVAAATKGPGRVAIEAVVELAASIADGVQLTHLVEDATPISRNAGFEDRLVLLRDPVHEERFGGLTLTVLGPTRKHLNRLRRDWDEWLDRHPSAVVPAGPGHGERAGSGVGSGADLATASDGPATIEQASTVISALVQAAEIIEKSLASKVTPPNRSSITLLAEEGTASVLLTGDAAETEILEGLTAAGRLSPGQPFRCTVLKVQHHGSEFNVSRGFAEQVLADHYVFCGDGAHDNPSPSAIKTLVTSRLDTPGPFTLWFTCSEERARPERRRAMRAALREARAAAERHPGRIEVNVLADDRSFLEIEV